MYYFPCIIIIIHACKASGNCVRETKRKSNLTRHNTLIEQNEKKKEKKSRGFDVVKEVGEASHCVSFFIFCDVTTRGLHELTGVGGATAGDRERVES